MSEGFVRVNLTLRKDDADYLRDLAIQIIYDASHETLRELVRRGERPGASMAVRMLIDMSRNRGPA